MSENQPTIESPKRERVRQQFAELCASGFPVNKLEARFAQGLDQFDLFNKLPFVQQIGVDMANQRVVVGTTCAFLRKTKDEPWRIIGEFIVTMKKMPADFQCFNITKTIDGYHHPHVNDSGIMCINNRQEIQLLLADGDYLEAFKIIWAALNTTNGAPYSVASADKWPVLPEET